MFRFHLFRLSVPTFWSTLALVVISLVSAFSVTAEAREGARQSGAFRVHNMVLPVVNFATNSAELNPKARVDLGELIQMLKEDSQMKLRVIGHTDSVGSKQANQRLSERRAQAVVGYLVDNGIARQRLNVQAVSENQPMKTNLNEPGRADNRRVVFAEE